MFEYMKQGSRLNAMTYFTSVMVSLAVHAAILCVVVALPLVFCRTLYPVSPLAWFTELPALSVQPPAPPPASPAKAVAGKKTVTVMPMESVPDKIPVGIPDPDDLPVPVIPATFGAGIGITGNGISPQGPMDESLIASLLSKLKLELQPPAPPEKSDPVQVGGDVQASKLIFKVDPVYPETARRAHVSGTVVLAAIIDEEGKVSDLRIVNGHPLLTRAAFDAVSRWRYSPTILNGEPVAVSAIVTVVFRLR